MRLEYLHAIFPLSDANIAHNIQVIHVLSVYFKYVHFLYIFFFISLVPRYPLEWIVDIIWHNKLTYMLSLKTYIIKIVTILR